LDNPDHLDPVLRYLPCLRALVLSSFTLGDCRAVPLPGGQHIESLVIDSTTTHSAVGMEITAHRMPRLRHLSIHVRPHLLSLEDVVRRATLPSLTSLEIWTSQAMRPTGVDDYAPLKTFAPRLNDLTIQLSAGWRDDLYELHNRQRFLRDLSALLKVKRIVMVNLLFGHQDAFKDPHNVENREFRESRTTCDLEFEGGPATVLTETWRLERL
jgi:hypothetical protein